MVKSRVKWTDDGASFFTFDGRYLSRVEWNPATLRWCWIIHDRAARKQVASGGGKLTPEEAQRDADTALAEVRRAE